MRYLSDTTVNTPLPLFSAYPRLTIASHKHLLEDPQTRVYQTYLYRYLLFGAMHRAYEISSALQAMMGEDGQRSGGGGHGDRQGHQTQQPAIRANCAFVH